MVFNLPKIPFLPHHLSTPKTSFLLAFLSKTAQKPLTKTQKWCRVYLLLNGVFCLVFPLFDLPSASSWRKDVPGMPNTFNKHQALMRTLLSEGVRLLQKTKKTVRHMKKHAFDLSVLVFVFVLGTYVFFPSVVNADTEPTGNLDAKTVNMIVASMQNETKDFGRLPMALEAKAKRTFKIPVTAYTSDVVQTDESPCITASGLNVCERNKEDIVAANFLPLGARVRIPDLYGDRVFYVQDRMNARYDRHLDIWMKDYQDAKQFGLKMTTIEVF